MLPYPQKYKNEIKTTNKRTKINTLIKKNSFLTAFKLESKQFYA